MENNEIIEHFTQKIANIQNVSDEVRAVLLRNFNEYIEQQIRDWSKPIWYPDQDRLATGCGWDECLVNFLNEAGYISTSYAGFQNLPDDIQGYIFDHSEGARIWFEIFTE